MLDDSHLIEEAQSAQLLGLVIDNNLLGITRLISFETNYIQKFVY